MVAYDKQDRESESCALCFAKFTIVRCRVHLRPREKLFGSPPCRPNLVYLPTLRSVHTVHTYASIRECFVVDPGVRSRTRNSTTRNRQQAKPGQSLRPGQASKKSCKKGLRNSRTKVPTPEAGALLSGLITLPTSTRGICVRVYTFRREYEREREREGKIWNKDKEICDTRRGNLACVHEREDAHVNGDLLSAKLDFMCDQLTDVGICKYIRKL